LGPAVKVSGCLLLVGLVLAGCNGSVDRGVCYVFAYNARILCLPQDAKPGVP
jgi:hypothetical protein